MMYWDPKQNVQLWIRNTNENTISTSILLEIPNCRECLKSFCDLRSFVLFFILCNFCIWVNLIHCYFLHMIYPRIAKSLLITWRSGMRRSFLFISLRMVIYSITYCGTYKWGMEYQCICEQHPRRGRPHGPVRSPVQINPQKWHKTFRCVKYLFNGFSNKQRFQHFYKQSECIHGRHSTAK